MLTGILDIATLENMCPPTWNNPIGKVVIKMAFDGARILVKRTRGDMKSRQ